MASTLNITSFKNLSLCVYIGNTSALDDRTLLAYCSRFGTIVSSSFEKEKFCDFHIIEYAKYEQLERFLNEKIHEINTILLDVKLYKTILTNNAILNIDRKFFIGPILNSNDIHIIIEFYKKIDAALRHCLSQQDKQVYLLFELNNRQSVTTIFEKQTIPITTEHRNFSIYRPLHPKEFVNKIISTKNKENQIHIHGLTNKITETMLIDYFHKRAPVIACHILLNDPTCAIIELNDKRTVRKILDTPNIRLQGTNLSLKKASRHLTSLLSSFNNKDDSDDDVDNYDDDTEVKSTVLTQTSVSEPSVNLLQAQNQSPLFILPSTHQENIQQQLLSFLNLLPPSVVTEPISIPSPEKVEAGWASPPRTIIDHAPSIDQLSVPSSSLPSATTTSNHTDLLYQFTSVDTDTKPIRPIPSNNLLNFVEQCQNELDQIRDEYRSKFAENRTYIEQEINLLIDEERQTLNKLDRYLSDHRRRVEKRNNNNKRKHYA
ncbi:unnamed protein product [Rotaria sp. Silwood1]|nr:unnamed protein product [Rotaria sp. Silwood1]CAF3321794.1 unnamed protein product [Rotaria sp. Silwood1]CAF3337676.1 unnamed protein product [Rotaria sp. Silwood1]CAF4711428.1 unnamed protein product [Rotaria sp. Silwood1]